MQTGINAYRTNKTVRYSRKDNPELIGKDVMMETYKQGDASVNIETSSLPYLRQHLPGLSSSKILVLSLYPIHLVLLYILAS